MIINESTLGEDAYDLLAGSDSGSLLCPQTRSFVIIRIRARGMAITHVRILSNLIYIILYFHFYDNDS